ncbi:MAG TPA: T9SS type A sorting domain-containing protein [Bacteroidia bacterium]|nr:T9SS type A sorting domain-containing protein [Bacteroidia bacterium]
MKNKLLTILLAFCSISVTAQISLPYSQDFETSLFPPTGWQTFPIGSSINWQYDTTVSAYGIGSACISFNNYTTAAGSYYGIRLPAMNFNLVSNPYIRFDVAYAQRTGASSDIFGLWWSNNGSSNWQNIINYSGGSLSTATSTANLFVPTPVEWQTKTLSLSSLAGLPYVRLAIEDDCFNGNKIYIDNIEVFDSLPNVNVKELSTTIRPLVYPNPAINELFIQNNSAVPIHFSLYNSIGEIVFEKTLIDHRSIINVLDYPKGLYFYILKSETEPMKSGSIYKQ